MSILMQKYDVEKVIIYNRENMYFYVKRKIDNLHKKSLH